MYTQLSTWIKNVSLNQHKKENNDDIDGYIFNSPGVYHSDDDDDDQN